MVKKLLYEINTRFWMHQLRSKYDESLSIANIPQVEIDQIAQNFDWVWLMGIWDHSSLDHEFLDTHPGLIRETENALEDWTEADIIGSPFSIKSYNIHPLLGSNDEFSVLKARFNNAGVQVMVDFVPNHYGIKSHHAIENPDYFINVKEKPNQDINRFFYEIETQKGVRWIALGKDPYFDPWDDTLQVNYQNPETRIFMIQELLSIAKISDGVRCDMAMLLNNDVFAGTWSWLTKNKWSPLKDEFWPIAIDTVKSEYPEFVFMAEVYWGMEWELLQMGFDYAYDKTLYDRIVDLDINGIHSHLTADFIYQISMCRFIENHDEERALEKMEIRQSLAAASMIMTLPGITLLHHGQLIGNRIKIPVQLLRKTKEDALEYLTDKYQIILDYTRIIILAEAIWHKNEVISASELPFDSLFSWTWQTIDQVFVVVVNYAGREADGIVKLNTKHPIFLNRMVDFVDYYNDERYEWHTLDLINEGLYVKLEDYGYHLFIIEEIVQ